MGQRGPVGAKRRVFSKMILEHVRRYNKCFWTVLRLWWPILVLRKSQNALKMGCFGTKNGSKMCQKCIFPNLILDHLGCTNGRNEPILSPFWGILAPQKSKKP